MEEEIPLKLIELSDFLRLPSILSKKLQFKQTKNEELFSDQLNKKGQGSNGLQFKDPQQGIVLLKKKAIYSDNNINAEYSKQNELIVPKDIIIFADDIDRKKIGLFNKSTNQFSRHLLITSGAALQALIPSLTNAKEWIIVCKLKYSKRYTKRLPIHGNVVISLNVNHPLVRYEILTAFDLLQQSFNEIKSAYIVIDFCQILSRWFKNYLQQTDQYPSLANRLLYRYKIQTNKSSITIGKRNSYQDRDYDHSENSFRKILHNSDIPMQIYIDFNSLPTIVYSIQLDNIFIYSMNDQYKQLLKSIGNGLSLVSIQNLHRSEDLENKSNNCSPLVRKEEIIQEKSSIQQQVQEKDSSSSSSYQPTEQEKILLEKILDNRMRIQMQHQQLMIKAAQLLYSSTLNNDSFSTKNNQSDLKTMNFYPY